MISVWQFSFPCTLLLLVTLNGVQTTPTTLKDLKSHYTDLSYWNGLKADFWVSSPVSTSDLTAKHHELQSERSEFEAQLDRQPTSSREVVLSLLDYKQQKKEYDVLDGSSAAALSLRNIWDRETSENGAEKLLQELAEGVDTYPALDELTEDEQKKIGYNSEAGDDEVNYFYTEAHNPAHVDSHPIKKTYFDLRDRTKVVIDAFTEHKSSLTYAANKKEELKDIEGVTPTPYAQGKIDKIKNMLQAFYDDHVDREKLDHCKAINKAIIAMDRKIGQIEAGNQKLFKGAIRKMLGSWKKAC